MKVTANKIGFYGQLRKVGESFNIKSKEALGSWMDEVKVKKAPVKEEVKVS